MGRCLPVLVLLALTACDDTTFGEASSSLDPDAPSCDSADHRVSFMMQTLVFAEADEDGRAWGFNLDEHDTELGDSKGCGKRDLESPEGTPGIDNAFAQLFPALENTEAVAIKGLLQDAVNAGELLVMVELYGVDDFVDDDCVQGRIAMASGNPIIGTDGSMLDGQSFARDYSVAEVVLDEAQIVDGALQATGLDLLLTLQILDAPLAIFIESGALHIDLDPEGREAWGYFGGGFSIDYMMEIVDGNAVDDTLTELLRVALPAAADVDGELGECRYMSVALEYDAVPAYFYGE